MADNDYSIVVGSTTWTNNAVTKVKDFSVKYVRNRPTVATVEVFDVGGTVESGLSLGAAFTVTLKSAAYKAFEGVVIGWEAAGGVLKVTGEDQLRRLRGHSFNEVFLPNCRRTNQVAINKDTSSVTRYYSDFQVSTDAVGYPLIRVDYVSPQTAGIGQVATLSDLIINANTTANYHAAQLFRAEGEYFEYVKFGDVAVFGQTFTLRIVLNDGSTSAPLPLVSGGNFVHAKMENGNDATMTSADETFNFVTGASPVRLIPGELYWVVLERTNDTDIWDLTVKGKSSSREYPYRLAHGSGHDPSTWTTSNDGNFRFVPKYRSSTSKSEEKDYELDKTAHRIFWGGTSGFVPDVDANGAPTGKCRVVYSYGTEVLKNLASYVFSRCGIVNYDLATGHDATYGNSTGTYTGPVRVIAKNGFEAMDALIADRWGNTGKTRRGRYFVSSSDGNDRIWVKLENLATDTVWKTVKNGKNAEAGDMIILENGLVKSVRFLPNKIIGIGKDTSDNPRAAIATDTTFIATIGEYLATENDQSAHTHGEAWEAAKARLDREYGTTYSGSVTVSGYWPEASGYFSITGNTFNDVLSVYDTDRGMTNVAIKAEEVLIRGSSFSTVIIASRRNSLIGVTGYMRDVEERMNRREAIDFGNEVKLAFRDNNASPAGSYAQFEVSGNAVLSWDGQVHRVPVTLAGTNSYSAIWPEYYLDLATTGDASPGNAPTKTRDITDMKFYTAYTAGSSQHTHTFTAQDKPRFPPQRRVQLAADEN